MAPLLSFEAVRKSFFGVEVLHGVSFTLKAGEILGLVGENGSGKSTSMNILGGVHRRDSGTILLDGKPFVPDNPAAAQAAGIAFIHQELNLFENLSIGENLHIGGFPRLGFLPLIDRRAIGRRTKDALESVDLDHPPSYPVARLSQGERQLVEIAKAISQDARIIIFDEPTTSLTNRETARLFDIIRRLKERGIAMIYISHILDDVLSLCDQVTVLRDGHVVGSSSVENMSRERMIQLMVGRELTQLFPQQSERPQGQPVLQLEDITQPGIVKDINLELRRGEVLGIAGLMGSGRSELARIVFGLDPFEHGQIIIDGEVVAEPTASAMMTKGIAMLTENRRLEGLLMEANIHDNAALPSLPWFGKGPLGFLGQQTLGKEINRAVDRVRTNTRDYVGTLAKHLSGGNQQKVVIAKWLMREPTIFILDEPTRGIDVGAKFEVYKIIDELAAGGTAVLMISSELEELIGIADRILVMAHGEIVAEHGREEFDRERILDSAMWLTKSSEFAQ